MLGLELGRGVLAIQGQINSKEDVKFWTSQANYDYERWGKQVEEEYFFS